MLNGDFVAYRLVEKDFADSPVQGMPGDMALMRLTGVYLGGLGKPNFYDGIIVSHAGRGHPVSKIQAGVNEGECQPLDAVESRIV